MKLECLSCQSRYTIDDSIVPPQGAKIRCRKCGAIIPVSAPVSTPARVEPARVEPAPTETPVVPSPSLPPISYTAPASPGFAPSSAPAAPPLPPAAAANSDGFSFLSGPSETRAAVHAAPSAAPDAAGLQYPPGLSADEKKKHEKARRLARVLASDIAIYNREKKDRGLAEGNLVAVLGYEIKKSWEIYKERVGADFANATPYFRDALNDLLAEGKKIF
jgi:predicted Zn finger-like uncharacterized protein